MDYIRKLLERYFHGDVRAVHACNYILFFLFAFLYLYGLQRDLIVLTLKSRFGINIVGYSLWIPLVLIALLLFLKLALNRFLRLKGRYHALSFVPLFLLLIFLTILEPTFSLLKAAMLCLVLLLYIPFISRLRHSIRIGDDFLTLLQPNLVVMLISFLFVTLMTNGNDVFHYELRLQRHLNRGDITTALKVAENEQATSKRLMALRIYALSRQGMLGEKLFAYPLKTKDTDFFLHESDVPSMIYPIDSVRAYLGFVPNEIVTVDSLCHILASSCDNKKRPPLADYLLCTLLVKKDLGAFVHWLQRFYDVSLAERMGNLPRHYREALVLYKAISVTPAVIFHSNQTETDFHDFKEQARQYPDTRIRRNMLRSVYGDTYWWYYWYGKES